MYVVGIEEKTLEKRLERWSRVKDFAFCSPLERGDFMEESELWKITPYNLLLMKISLEAIYHEWL